MSVCLAERAFQSKCEKDGRKSSQSRHSVSDGVPYKEAFQIKCEKDREKIISVLAFCF